MRYLIGVLVFLVVWLLGCSSGVTDPPVVKEYPEVCSLIDQAPAESLTAVRLVMEPTITPLEAVLIVDAAAEWEQAGCRLHFVLEYSDVVHGANEPHTIRFRHGDPVGHEGLGAKAFSPHLLQTDIEIYATWHPRLRTIVLHELGHALDLGWGGSDHYRGEKAAVMHPALEDAADHLEDVDVLALREIWQCSTEGTGQP
jgi:hypothetical protein